MINNKQNQYNKQRQYNNCSIINIEGAIIVLIVIFILIFGLIFYLFKFNNK